MTTVALEDRRGGLSSMKDAMRAFLSESGLGSKLKNGEVLHAWSAAAGPALSGRARPVGFRHGELVVAVRSAPHFQELKSFTGEGIRRAANKRLGGERIRSVTFRLEQ